MISKYICKVTKKSNLVKQVFLFIVATVHKICPTQYTDAQIIETASTWLAQASTRLKRVMTKNIREGIVQNNAMEQNGNDDNINYNIL